MASSAELAIPRACWERRRAAHHARVDRLTAARRARAAAGLAHPVEDFLFTYYPFRIGALRRWSPGWGAALEGESAPEGEGWWSREGAVLRVAEAERDATALRLARFIRDLCAAVAARPAFHGCFGLHEWAMVYRSAEARRHAAWPLRLGAEGTDAVVESMPVRCGHFDAFRFFTPEARPLNRLQPDLAGRLANEQPGCIHVNMDLYKWAMKLRQLVPSELAADAFDLALRARETDMRASPYDLRALGLEPIRVETPEGRADYEATQRALAEAAAPIRARLLAACDLILGA
ncbi:MAG: 3-methyladenine DNA glycosylase [Opitutia bacterium]|jgi:hypothetical protein